MYPNAMLRLNDLVECEPTNPGLIPWPEVDSDIASRGFVVLLTTEV